MNLKQWHADGDLRDPMLANRPDEYRLPDDLAELKRLAEEMLIEVGNQYTKGAIGRYRQATPPGVVLALINRVKAAESAAWVPIGDAPKDGSSVILGVGASRSVGYWSDRRQCWVQNGTGKALLPSLYMDLPLLPGVKS